MKIERRMVRRRSGRDQLAELAASREKEQPGEASVGSQCNEIRNLNFNEGGLLEDPRLHVQLDDSILYPVGVAFNISVRLKVYVFCTVAADSGPLFPCN